MKTFHLPALRIGLSQSAVTIVRVSGWLFPRLQVLAETSFEETSVHAEAAVHLDYALADLACLGRQAAIILDDAWVRYFMVNPPAGGKTPGDYQAAAASRFQSLYNRSPDDWLLQGDWQPDTPFLSCAIPSGLVAALQKVVSKHEMGKVSVVPHFVAAWNRWSRQAPSRAWFGLVHGDVLTLGPRHERKLSALRSTALPPQAHLDRNWLAVHCAREAARLNMAPPRELRLCGEIPRSWEEQDGFQPSWKRLDRPSGRATSRGVLLACGGARP